MKRIFFGFAWMLLSVGVILTSIAGMYVLDQAKKQLSPLPNEPQVAVALPSTDQDLEYADDSKVKGVSTIVEVEDSRAKIVTNFLSRYDSPLKPYDYYGEKLVEIADTYNLDFRLLPAIAMQESNLCKAYPEGTHNCLGFGIHSQGTLGFDSYEASFERAAKEIKANYVDIGLTSPEEIMTKYTPSSNGSWAESVNQWMAEMRYDDRDLGRELKTNADVLEFTQPETSTSTQN